MKILDITATILVIIGGLNWGLIGVLNMDVVALVLGEGTLLTKIVYDIVGLAALYMIYVLFKKSV